MGRVILPKLYCRTTQWRWRHNYYSGHRHHFSCCDIGQGTILLDVWSMLPWEIWMFSTYPHQTLCLHEYSGPPSPNSYAEILFQGNCVRKCNLQKVLRSRMRLMPSYKRPQRASFPLPLYGNTARRQYLWIRTDAKPVGTIILDFSASRTKSNTFFLSISHQFML